MKLQIFKSAIRNCGFKVNSHNIQSINSMSHLVKVDACCMSNFKFIIFINESVQCNHQLKSNLYFYVNGELKTTQSGNAPFKGFHTVSLTKDVAIKKRR